MGMTTKFRSFYFGLDLPSRHEYARRAGTTNQYVLCHLVGIPPRRNPRRELIYRLVEASDGALTIQDMFDHFFVVDKGKVA